VKRHFGFTLVELVAFIAIAGVVAVAMVQVFGVSLSGVAQGRENVQAVQLAQQRMDLIVGQRLRLGYTAFNLSYDPCTLSGWTNAVCNPTVTGVGAFVVTSSNVACGAGCRSVTVNVTSPQSPGSFSLTREFWEY
jgi:type II secretory pathway pseudopilin PulG